ncbi:MAG: precorrin-3B C(17)-methyltransferase [Lachnospiraceae bacterium]|nr:precorrin-3B C(17)-methyltransferase [Lachnospiraceae bacterium]
MGAGDYEGMTIKAVKAIEAADKIVGYTKYIELIHDIFPGKETYATGMMQEVQRCQSALDMALSGENIVIVCSGDAGVYGMAGLVLELTEEDSRYSDIDIEVIPGVTAALSGGAILGAPLMHDFSVISLSDLMTPWDVIEKRLDAAASSDMAIVLYNPSSKKRSDYLSKACDIFLKYKPASTICGIASNIGREGEAKKIVTLGELKNTETDMFSTVFIGNSNTKVIGGMMVTPRGYTF